MFPDSRAWKRDLAIWRTWTNPRVVPALTPIGLAVLAAALAVLITLAVKASQPAAVAAALIVALAFISIGRTAS
jgi:hypothetical protein